jgi:hypothetical protein
MSDLMLGAIAVLIDIGQAPPEHVESAVRSCEVALGVGQCALVSMDPEPAEFRAVVTWRDPDASTAAIELRRANDDVVVALRQLEFAEQDALRDRVASIGVVIAALVVGEHNRAQALPPPEPEPRRIEQPLPIVPAPKPEPDNLSWRLDLAAAAHVMVEQSSPQIGPLLRVSVEARAWHLFGLASVAYIARPSGSPDLSAVNTGFGLGVRLANDSSLLALELRSELCLQWLTASAAVDGDSERGSELRIGPRIGVDGLVDVGAGWALSIGGEAALLRPEVVIEVRGEQVARATAFNWAIVAGIRRYF